MRDASCPRWSVGLIPPSMQSLLVHALAISIAMIAVYLGAGYWLSLRKRRSGERVDRALHRALFRSQVTVAALLGLGALHFRSDWGALPEPIRVVSLYAVPLLWLWGTVLGGSWLELRARGLDESLLRFYRFNLFTVFLMSGQRVPLLSAALAVPVDLATGKTAILAHFGAAVLLGLLLRAWVVLVVARISPYPDRRLAVRVREIARMAGVKVRGVFQVRTERGQSVNAFASTTSRLIYVAEGMREGLERDEVKAVLLHEVGHLDQRATNLFRNLAALWLPLAIWLARAGLRAESPERYELLAGAVLLALFARLLTRAVFHSSEIRADRFAARWSPPGALASALRKLYDRNLVLEVSDRRQSHPALEERLRLLEESASA